MAELASDGMQASQFLPLLRPRMRELDTLRGIAALSVVIFHCFRVPDPALFGSAQRLFIRVAGAGQFGVNLFFVLSGFLITGLLLDSRNRPDYYKRFYIRRALRILPAYYAILFLLAIFQIISRRFLIAGALYSANLAPLFGISIASYAVLWSLGVEEHFYLVWPAVVHRITLRTVMAVSVGIIVVSPVLRFVCTLHAIPHHFQGSECGYYTWNSADGLAYGALLAVVMRAYSFQRRQLLWFSLFSFGLGGIITLVGLPFGVVSRANAVGGALQAVPWDLACLGALSAFILIGTSKHQRLVTPSFLLFLGDISYGLYLVHLLVIIGTWKFLRWAAPGFLSSHTPTELLWVGFAIVGPLSVLVAYVSRWYFEEPFLKLKNRLAPSVDPIPRIAQ
jgi:peptidoglycan/LPS O-acetylase OafA/YrhL